ncbi:3-hydroxyacyl-CoA dehydrogenase [Roseimaritima sediminicola]|uniref:3-hydroxyacyl-CoA dehydrogenase n=1 Tax=Roseimaritima sediminicola TaxID=2662066 RepID=UPI001298380D|nr:3-hydroxyacyl-CoA dehydrogenase [Roseimaritima sediminicola]
MPSIAASSSPHLSASGTPPIYLIGCGVVGQAILDAHLDAACSVWLCDLDADRLAEVCRRARREHPGVEAHRAPALGDRLPMWRLEATSASPAQSPSTPDQVSRSEAPVSRSEAPENGSSQTTEPAAAEAVAPLVIESIFEQRQAKRTLLADLQRWLGPRATLCSNTSTLTIGGLSEGLDHPGQCCGMHFFMPVRQRNLVEIVVPEQASAETIHRARQHSRRLGKPALAVADTPGFVVNRMLSPYLNEAMRLLCEGASAEQLERVAVDFGMPFSPLELVDWIGTRTAFDAGRVYWQAFPRRLEPSPLLPGLIKAGLGGRAAGEGFFRYDDQRRTRSAEANPAALAVVERYRRGGGPGPDDREVFWRLFLPMLVEADLILADAVVTEPSEIDTAMRGGLGLRTPGGFFSAFEPWEPERIAEELYQRADQRSFAGAERLRERLAQGHLRPVSPSKL